MLLSSLVEHNCTLLGIFFDYFLILLVIRTYFRRRARTYRPNLSEAMLFLKNNTVRNVFKYVSQGISLGQPIKPPYIYFTIQRIILKVITYICISYFYNFYWTVWVGWPQQHIVDNFNKALEALEGSIQNNTSEVKWTTVI